MALLYRPYASANHLVDSPRISLIGGHATRLECVESLIASLVKQNKRSEIPLADYKARVMLSEQNCLMQSVQRLAVLFLKFSDQQHLAYIKLLLILVCSLS